MASEVQVEIERKRIAVHFPFDRADVQRVRTIAGRNFNRSRKVWTVPLDLAVCRQLRELFGKRLVIGPALRSWATQQVRQQATLGSIATAQSAALVNLPKLLPSAYRALYLGPLGKHAAQQGMDIDGLMNLSALLTNTEPWDPNFGSYQTADVRFLADSTAPLNANHQGLGKTLEAIAEVYEAGRAEGAHLVIAPQKAIEATWVTELLKWQEDAPYSVEIFPCTGNKAERQAMLEEFEASDADVRWVIVNPQMIMWRKDTTHTAPHIVKAKPKDAAKACMCGRIVDPHWHYDDAFPTLTKTKWASIINDEIHKGNIRNHRSLTAKAVNALPRRSDGKAVAMSGTPMKKQGADIWGTLHYLRPDVFTSYWNFAQMFFDVEDNGYGMKVKALLPSKQADFFEYLKPYVLRRTKDECLPWLPAKQYIDVVVKLEGKQAKQYNDMQLDAIANVSNAKLPAKNILDEYIKLQQFAGAFCELRDGDVWPTRTSAKLDALWENLDAAGILDNASDDKTLIFSQSKRMIELVAAELASAGVEVAIVSGDTKDTGVLVDLFQNGTLKVLCIVTTAGGVSLTLDAADTAHFLDETWAPDDQEQAEDRIHRASRIHQVTIYRYVAEGTIDEVKAEVSMDKADAHSLILDVRRRLVQGAE